MTTECSPFAPPALEISNFHDPGVPVSTGANDGYLDTDEGSGDRVLNRNQMVNPAGTDHLWNGQPNNNKVLGAHAFFEICDINDFGLGQASIETLRITRQGFGYEIGDVVVFSVRRGVADGSTMTDSVVLNAAGRDLLNHPNPAPLPTPGGRTTLVVGEWPAGNVTGNRIPRGYPIRPGEDVLVVVPEKGSSFVNWYRWNVPGYPAPKNFDASGL